MSNEAVELGSGEGVLAGRGDFFPDVHGKYDESLSLSSWSFGRAVCHHGRCAADGCDGGPNGKLNADG